MTTYITFRRRGRSKEIHRAGFDLESDEANTLAILKHAHNTNSEIIADSTVNTEANSYGVRCLECGEWETACKCEVDA